jgi:ubiquinone/menaquinone biosynthesis C-methylase UbiE
MLAETGEKAVVQAQWDAAAEGWDAQTPAIRAWLRVPTDAMIAMAGVEPGHRVLDVAAGAGDQTLDIAARVGPQGSVVATDLSPALVERIRANAARAGVSGIEARTADGEARLPEGERFDAAVCRLGLMLMPAPERCLASVAAALRPGGRFCAMAFAGPQENPCLRILISTALRHAGIPPKDPYAPGGLLSLGKLGLLDDIFRATGFDEVATTKMEAPFHLPRVGDYLAFIRAAAGPVRALLGRLDAAAQSAAWADIEDQLRAFDGPDCWTGPNTLLLTVGRRPQG